MMEHGRDYESTSHEEPRNDEAALEGEAKDSMKNHSKLCSPRGIIIKKLQAECNKLKDDVNKIGIELESSRKAFRAVTGELKKQLDVAKQRESEILTKSLGLRLENEKLQVLLESKNSLIDKLRRELLSAKRVLKFAIKDICNVSRLSDMTFSEACYDDFERTQRSPRSVHSPRSHHSPRSPRVRFAESLDPTLDNSSVKTRRDTKTL